MSATIDEDETETVAESDTRIAKEVAKYPEARQWLGGSNHIMFEVSKEAASKLVESLYAAGAVKVYVADAGEIVEGSGNEVAATFVVELPADTARRKKVFEAEAAWWEDGEDATKDEGQKYFEIYTD